MSVDDKLNMLINSMSKLEEVPNDIAKMQNSIKTIQNDLKEVLIMKEKIKTLENDIVAQKHENDISKNTTDALEESLTSTQYK